MARPRIRRYLRHGLVPQLIAFEACLRLGGVTRAAEELALAQSTVSGLLRKLSDTVGAPVLVARGGRVELTDEGRDVMRLCEEILDSLGRFEQARNQRVTSAQPGDAFASPSHRSPYRPPPTQ